MPRLDKLRPGGGLPLPIHPAAPVHASDVSLVGAYGDTQSQPIGSVFEKQSGYLRPDAAIQLVRQEPMLSGAIATAASQAMLARWRTSRAVQANKSVSALEPLPSSHWLARTMRHINPYTTPAAFMRDLRMWSMIYAAYFAIELTPQDQVDRGAPPVQLYTLLPQYLRPLLSEDGQLIGWQYQTTSTGLAITLAPVQVVQLPGPSYDRLYEPISPLEPLRDAARIPQFLTTRVGQFYKDQTIIPGFIRTPNPMNENERLAMERNFAENMRNARSRRSRIMVLADGAEYNPLKEGSPVDATQSGDSPTLRMVAQAIYGCTQVPIELFSRSSEARERDEWMTQLWEHNLLPFLVLVEETLTKHLAMAAQENLRIHTDTTDVPALSRRRLDAIRVQTAQLNSGSRTLNEVRAEDQRPHYAGEAEDFANLPLPYVNQSSSGSAPTDASPSLTLPGSEGGRDKTENGEAGMVDETGARTGLDEIFTTQLFEALF